MLGCLTGKVKHLVLFLLSVFFLTGCQFAAIPTPTENPPAHILNIPESGALIEVALGETVCAKGIIYTRKGLKLKKPISTPLGKIKCGAGFYKECLEDSKWTYYMQIANPTLGVPKANLKDL